VYCLWNRSLLKRARSSGWHADKANLKIAALGFDHEKLNAWRERGRGTEFRKQLLSLASKQSWHIGKVVEMAEVENINVDGEPFAHLRRPPFLIATPSRSMNLEGTK
jgi:hypothetical protein